jgi:hypothetical protein
MPHSYGYRGRTRDMFSRAFKRGGVNPLSTYMTTYKVSLRSPEGGIGVAVAQKKTAISCRSSSVDTI